MPTTKPTSFSLEWKVSQGLWGTEIFTVDAQHRARYRFDSAVRGAAPVESERTLETAELEPLVEAVGDPRFCALTSKRNGIPDEGRPTLTMVLDDRTCSVTLWDGEWRDLEAARPVLDAVNTLLRSMQE